MSGLAVAAWACLAVVGWTFFGYPAALLLVRRQPKRGPVDLEALPGISLVVPTYNERRSIETKIENIRALDYPSDRLEVVVVDSASTDGTPDAVRRTDPSISVIVEPEKRGKARAITTVLPLVRNDIIVITDANAFMKPDALKIVASQFSDPRVGAATGAMRQVDRSATAVSEGGGAYWKLEVFMRQREAALHSVVAMSGEISAFRRSLFLSSDGQAVRWYKPGGTDDFEMTLWVIRHGFRVAYASEADVWEYAPDSAADFYRQKVRIIVQTIVTVGRNLDIVMKTGWYGWFTFWSRKVLPLVAPFALIALAVLSVWLAPSSVWWRVVGLAQLIGYSLAALALGPLKRFSPARLALFFVLLNGTVLVAWLEYVRGKDYTSWKPIASSR